MADQEIVYIPTDEEKKVMSKATNQIVEILKPFNLPQRLMVLDVLNTSLREMYGVKGTINYGKPRG